MPPPDAVPNEAEELWKVKTVALKKEEMSLVEDKEKYDREKLLHARECKRVRDEERSKYSDFPVLHERYLLLHLLGKGGFSEVYKAFDLFEMRIVACKIHQLNSQWGEEKKANYMRHATREYTIQKQLLHERVVRLFDVFEVSNDCFCTVLEFCEDGDLDEVLKMQRILPEREARCIVIQVLNALRYFNEQKQKIIHYDLKPANILFHKHEVKITDFGLSKVMDDNEDSAMELTSQGAGTYWYLPPECFQIGRAPPRISSKVDVWSVGVIFYQMLFGSKPFGDGMSQDQILIDQTITKSTTVQFPTTPKVSAEAKEFIKKCLAYSQDERMDVLTAFCDPYLRKTKI